MQIKAKNLNYIYGKGTAFEQYAMRNMNFEIEKGSFVGIIGHTGSGKSTLIQHLNGLLKATSGELYFHDKNIYSDGYDMKSLRQKVGLVFQYPEHQLFEIDVLADVSFGPKNQGFSSSEVKDRAIKSLQMVGLGEEFYKKSPFELSGGQKRRVAIAGVLAMQPEVLVLDEPTAGLDPKGRDEILDTVDRLRKEMGITIILVSHSMEDVAKYVDRLLVLSAGEIILDDAPHVIFKEVELLEGIGLRAPQITYIVRRLRQEGIDIDENITTIQVAKEAILSLTHRNGIGND